VPNSGLGLASFLLGDTTSFRRYVSETLDTGERQKRLYLRPDLLGDPSLSDPTRDKWFASGKETLGTVWGQPAALKLGTAARHSLRGPGVAQMDLSFFKNWQLWEDAKIQFRAEFFNIFNRTNLGLPNGTVDSPTAGQITSIFLPMRRIQWAVRYTF
jgi:hypothetical protein